MIELALAMRVSLLPGTSVDCRLVPGLAGVLRRRGDDAHNTQVPTHAEVAVSCDVQLDRFAEPREETLSFRGISSFLEAVAQSVEQRTFNP